MRMLDVGITLAVQTFVEAMGMVAENQVRAAEGKSPAYDEAAFDELIKRNGCHWNGAIGRWER